MRKLIATLALILLLPCWCFSQEIIVAKKKASGACNTASTSCIATTGSDENVSPNYYYSASSFTMGETATVCSIELELKKGTASGTYKVGIYSNNSGEPGTLIGSWSDNYNVSDLTTSYVYTAATKTGGLGAALTASTLYWIVVYASSGALQDNLLYYAYTDCLVGSNYHKRSDNGTTWANGGNTTGPHFKLYK